MRRAALLLALLLLQACATPAQRLRATALELGFEPLTVPADGFLVASFYKPGARPGGALHVYLEGDGTPWITRTHVAGDPTPRNPLMLRLMAHDETPSLYLGRPCYNGHAQDAGCHPLLWTHRRYSPEIVHAMATALDGFLRSHPHRNLAFFGHSGGGALAMLLAGRFPSTRSVVTLAANLDIAAWADHHGYSRLGGSLDPLDVPASGYEEWHYLGARDDQVPSDLLRPRLERRPHAHLSVVENADHVCCWDAVWLEILRGLR
ncbi:alpha/beta fold hydrolase [Methylococcus sp. EFPC2]|uniref:alpha/beta fold hydrolase n=1 Tax=Methylococcus sp. EFPC2 TaxID=2812648 RepID=UPI001967B888|nr:alpha/beta hydrolase [Methylococcus sp. EFPC2]QSA96412.1 alpha/beta hydrolase [Methylococcus sp. EFPC2]